MLLEAGPESELLLRSGGLHAPFKEACIGGKSGLEAGCGQEPTTTKRGGVGNVGHVAVGRGALVVVMDLG